MEAQRIMGRIIKVSKQGWGFISSRDIEFTRIFFHWTALEQSTLPFLELKIGMIVEFMPIKIPNKGYRAIHMIVISNPIEANNGTSNVPTLQERGLDDDREHRTTFGDNDS